MWLVLALLLAHEFYDPMCCSDKDCRPLPTGSVKETPTGYQTQWETIPYRDARVKVSPDGQFHVCYSEIMHQVRCIYVPERNA